MIFAGLAIATGGSGGSADADFKGSMDAPTRVLEVEYEVPLAELLNFELDNSGEVVCSENGQSVILNLISTSHDSEPLFVPVEPRSLSRVRSFSQIAIKQARLALRSRLRAT